MAGVVLIRPDDHLILAVRWKDFTVSGNGAAALLIAGADARLLITLPPQHVAEEATVDTDTAGSDKLGVPGGGAQVPAWRGALAAPTRLAFKFAPNTQIPLTAKGVLTALTKVTLLASPIVPSADDTAIELPFRLVIAPNGRASRTVACRHLTTPAATDSSGVWRTRLLDPGSTINTQLDPDLYFTVVAQAIAKSPDPTSFKQGNFPALSKDKRERLFDETANNAGQLPTMTRLTRLELSALGGTLDAAARFPTLQWDHRAVFGRDMNMRFQSKGVLFPFGHRAEFQTVAERIYDETLGAAVLRLKSTLTILEPIRRTPTDARIRRSFPFEDVEITQRVFTNLEDPEGKRLTTTIPGIAQPVPTHFWPRTLPKPASGEAPKLLLPITVTARTTGGQRVVVRLAVPMLFVDDKALTANTTTLSSPVVAEQVAKDYAQTEVRIPPTQIDLAAAATPKNNDVHEVHALTIAGLPPGQGLNLADGYRAKLAGLELRLPALRAMVGDNLPIRATLSDPYVLNGTDGILLNLTRQGGDIGFDFTSSADRSGGLVAPKCVVNALHRDLAVVKKDALPASPGGDVDVQKLIDAKATLLGMPLRSLLTQVKQPPQLSATLTQGAQPVVEMKWENVKLQGAAGLPLVPAPDARLTLTVKSRPGSSQTTCTLTNFALNLPPVSPVLKITFSAVTYTQTNGDSPHLDVQIADVTFLGDLELLQGLKKAVDLTQAGKIVDVRPTGVTARYSRSIDLVPAGAFNMRNMAFSLAVDVPFAPPQDVVVRLGFARRAAPFQLSVMMFGGGGYIELALNRDGVTAIEAALEFGAFMEVNFVIARGEVHAIGGVRFKYLEAARSVELGGYLRIGGSVEVLGLISVSIELSLELKYRSTDKSLVGRAVLVIEIDLTLWSERVELDSGEWRLPGGAAIAGALDATLLDRDALRERWVKYRGAFRSATGAAAPTRSLTNQHQ